MGFAVLADLKNQLNIPSSDTSNDAELTLYLNTSNEVCESLIGPSASTAFTEIQGTVDGSIVLMKRPLISVTSVTPITGNVLGTVLPSTAYLVDVNRGGLTISGYTGDFQVVYQAGWAVIPARATLMLIIIAQHLWETQRGGMAASVVSPQDTVSIPGLGFAIPKRAAELANTLNAPSTVPGIA